MAKRFWSIAAGFLPTRRTRLPGAKDRQDGTVGLSGIARYRLDDQPGRFTPSNDPKSGHWYHYDIAAMETAMGIDLLPLVIEADATPNPGGLPIGGLTQITLTNNHLQYATTWYGLAVALVGVYIVFRRQQAASRHPS